MVIPRPTAAGVIGGTITRVRLPQPGPGTRYPLRPDQRRRYDVLRVARYEHDSEGNPTGKVTAGRPVPGVRVRVVRRDEIVLDRITDDEAREEGYQDHRDAMTWFLRTYGGAWTDTRGWVLRVRVEVPDTVRLLARQDGALSEKGPDVEDAGQYVESAARALYREPEAVDPALVYGGAAALQARQRYQREQLMRQQRQAQHSIGQRIDQELEAMRSAGITTWQYEQRLLSRLRAMENRRAGQ